MAQGRFWIGLTGRWKFQKYLEVRRTRAVHLSSSRTSSPPLAHDTLLCLQTMTLPLLSRTYARAYALLKMLLVAKYIHATGTRFPDTETAYTYEDEGARLLFRGFVDVVCV